MTKTTVCIAENIRSYRLKKGLSMRELAEKANLSPGFICQCEHGQKQPRLETLGKLAAALGCTSADILEEPSERRAV